MQNVVFRPGRLSIIGPTLFQWDYGQVVKVSGLPSTANLEVHLATASTSKAVVKEVTVNSEDNSIQFDIPNSLLQVAEQITCYIYSDTGTAGETIRTIILPVSPRQQPEDYITPADTERTQLEQWAAEEETRKANESDRISAESGRVTAENERVTAENNRVSAETARVNAETARQTGYATMDGRINSLSEASEANDALAAVLAQAQRQAALSGAEWEVESGSATISPANTDNTISITKLRNRTTYNVTVEVNSVSGGTVGDIIISDKQANGFKVKYTGTATSITIRYHVQGGMV